MVHNKRRLMQDRIICFLQGATMSKRKQPRTNSKPPMTDRRAMEAFSAKIQQLLSTQNFSSIEEANSFLAENLTGMHLDDIELAPKSSLEKAQALVWEAFDTNSKKKRIALAKEAIEISPDCADAYTLLAEMSDSGTEIISYLRQAVEAGKRSISHVLDKDPKDYPFWQVLETRPYMRALESLASALFGKGDEEESIALWKELLRLNPNDNQGVRYTLIPILVGQDKLSEVEDFILKYDGDVCASFLFSKALFLFKKHGDTIESRKALKEAVKRNKYVMEFFLGRRKFSNSSGPIAFGSPEEAEEYVLFGAAGWVKDPAAVEWTADVLGGASNVVALTKKGRGKSGK